MSRCIYKYPLALSGSTQFYVRGGRFLSVALDGRGMPCAYFEVEADDYEVAERQEYFVGYFTGSGISEVEDGPYVFVGTVNAEGIVTHYYRYQGRWSR